MLVQSTDLTKFSRRNLKPPVYKSENTAGLINLTLRLQDSDVRSRYK